MYGSTVEQYELQRRVQSLLQALKIELPVNLEREREEACLLQIECYFRSTREITAVDVQRRAQYLEDQLKHPSLVNLVNAMDQLTCALQLSDAALVQSQIAPLSQ